MVDLRTDYDANDRAHQLVRDLYRETTGIDLVTGERGPPALHDLPAQTSGSVSASASAPNAGAESSAGKKAAKKSRGRKLAAQEDEDEAEPDVDDDFEGAGNSEVDEDLDQDRGEETSDEEDDLPIIMTLSQSKAGTSKSKPRSRPTTTKATIATSRRRQHLTIDGYTVSHGARNAHTTRQAMARTQPFTPLQPIEVEDPSSSSPLSEPPTSLVSKPHTMRRLGRVVRNNVEREPVATSHADSDADGDEEMGDAASVPAPVSTSRHPAPQQRQEEHTQTFVQGVGRLTSVGFAAKPAPPPRHPTTGPNTGVIAAGAAMFPSPRPSANPTPTPMPTTSTSTSIPIPSGIPNRLALALNHPSIPLSASLTTSLGTMSTFPQLIGVKSASFRRDFSSLGGMGSVVVKGCFAAVGEGQGEGEGARWVDVGVEDRYVEWVGAVGEVRQLQGQGVGVGVGMGGMVVLVVETKEREGGKGRENGHGTGLRGGSGAGNGGNGGSGGSGGDGMNEEGMVEDEMPLSRPTTPSSPHHGSSKSSKTPSSRGSVKTRAHATMEAYSPSNAVSHGSMAGKSSSAIPSQQPQQSQHISSVFKAAQQTRRSHSQGRPAFAFTESEEDTDEEEMIEVPRAYFERLELSRSKRNETERLQSEQAVHSPVKMDGTKEVFVDDVHKSAAGQT